MNQIPVGRRWLQRQLAPLALLITVTSTCVCASSGDTREWQFKVFLDDREIGYHDFRIIDEGESLRVETQAHFDVKVLFVNAFRYRHRNVETWDANCLAGIHATTTANGETFIVRGDRAASAFRLDTGDRETLLPTCIMTFAYWNPEFLNADRLLNSQTGEYEAVEIAHVGDDTVEVDGQRIAASRYQLLVKDKPMTLWYAADDGRWLALASVARGGRVLRYQPLVVPPSTNTLLSPSKRGPDDT